MRKIFLTTLLLGATVHMMAQDTYLNHSMINNGGELYGTSRYVGMGGAMGALGADLSCMSFNPAGIGLYRRSDIGFTAGAQWNTQKVEDVKNARGTFDQIGMVYTMRTNGMKVPFISLGFNYQKKQNYSGAFVADNLNLKGLSQMDQLAEMVNGGFGTGYNLAGAAEYYQFFTPVYLTDANGNPIKGQDGKEQFRYINKYSGQEGYYTHTQHGGQNTFDINLSGNVNDRVYFGFTAGFESIKYRATDDYYEKNNVVEDGKEKFGDYSLFNDYMIDGWGFNMKMGLIVRPFEERPFRVGLAMETPTWYQMSSNTLYQLYDEVEGIAYHPEKKETDESYLEYSLHSPIKGRLSIGSTVDKYLAWDVDYEFANYGKSGMGYPRNINYDGSAQLFNNETDRAMNQLTGNTYGFQHTLRAGIEAKPTDNLSVRLGYNFASSPCKDGAKFDQYSIDSYAMDYATNTAYMTAGNAHTMTLGLGYKYKKFYVDLAYKVRAQKADFYAFDDSFTDANSQFSIDNPGLSGVKLDPVEANLGRQQMTCTLGFKF